MDGVFEFIKKNHMIKQGEIIGVACSGGRDSICLLHYLNSIKAELDCEVVAINVDHSIRATSALDTEFVMNFCKEHGIKAYKFKVEALKVAKDEKLTLEQGARKARYGVFESCIQRGLVDKIALAHHQNDQVETILMNIFRGCGLSGVQGMEPVRDKVYIRPLLDTPREEIMAYLDENGLDYVEDETNQDNSYSRNYVRNVIMPAIRRQFKSVDKNIVNFSKICKIDDDYINSKIDMSACIQAKDYIKIPLSYFYQDTAIVNRMLLEVFAKYSKQDVESKHINMVHEFALQATNGNVISLPFGLNVYKEYDYIVMGTIKRKHISGEYEFRSGKLHIDGYGVIRTTTSKVFTEPKLHQHIIDADKLPQCAIWRFRQEGDTFAPLGLSGTKKLKEYFIDKKVPQRMRDSIPLLVVGNRVLAVGDIEIAEELKVDENSTHFYKINYEKDLV